MSMLLVPLLLLALIPLVVALVRANELFCLRIEGGRVRVKRGHIPQQLLNDIADVFRAPPAAGGSLRGVVEDRRLRLYAEAELTEAQRQRLRNIAAMWPVAKIRNAPRG
jgi:hypothetical protein